MSSFSGLNIGLSSLYASRRALELTGQNVSNVNTEGYSRQRADLQSVGGPVTPAMHSKYDGAGNGVKVAGVDRLRDLFLEARALTERGTSAGLTGDRVLLGRVEAVLSEPGDAGIQRQLADFWDGWDDVANKPDSLAARSQVLERAQTLAAGINGAVDKLDAQYDASHQQLSATVLDINAVAAGVAEFNRAIVSATRSGLSPNDLLDKRDVLVQRLGELAGVTVTQGELGSVDVKLGDRTLVEGATSSMLKVRGTGGTPPGSQAVAVAWGDPGNSADVGPDVTVGGSAGSLSRGLNDVLPRYRGQLTDIAAKVRAQVDAVHTGAFDRDGQPGMAFFLPGAGGKIAVNPLLTPDKVAASGTYVEAGTVRGGDRGGAKAAQLAELGTAKGGADELYRRTVVALGVEAQAAGRRVEIQDNVLAQIDAARESESGVNLDEEMTNMLAFQRAYEGAARFVSAIDQMLDTLINRTGVVGR
ncbi:MAG: Flagellar hook-associated protein FlgK [uncultured Blastococcus sp.]|uniref:Flagellar hook-associated protein 1 n=1 Tax=uncultured Blastococcus sp. TaxID=217144 RepID=A0A6J4H325_9ACTN|nr:MAG: Flagellar hook-associated protein FlgK [uncultured Blastococcus sp.]